MGSPRIKVALILGGNWGRGLAPQRGDLSISLPGTGPVGAAVRFPQAVPCTAPSGSTVAQSPPHQVPLRREGGPGGAGADQRCLVSQRGRVSLML